MPITRRIWAKRGSRPTAPVQERYQWLYVNGFVCPQSGETFWLLMPTVSLPVFEIVLREFAKSIGAGAKKHIIIVIDGAGFHQEKNIKIPQGIHLVYLPPYSPELQPSEKLWPLSNESLANRHFENIEELEDNQVEQCRRLMKSTDIIRSHCLFHWWPIVYESS